MKLHFIDEPLLEFGRGQDICPRKGITLHDVYDTRLQVRRDRILVGAAGTSEGLSKLSSWLHKCSSTIPPKENNNQPNLFPEFCGFNQHIGFKASFVLQEDITRRINNSDIRKIIKVMEWNAKVNAAVELYYQQVKFLAQNRAIDIVVCVIPDELYDAISKEEIKPLEETVEDEQSDDSYETNFRRALKAKTMHLGKPIQLVRELSLEFNKGQQDLATKAWNFCTALYYKANRTVPWRLAPNIHKPSVCFVGIGFYRSRDRKVLNTSIAQIFDELGNGVILRGTPVAVDKDDRTPHLTNEQAYELLTKALAEYEVALHTTPSRLVIHKSSNYNGAEMSGFREATEDLRVKAVDFITILDTDMRILRSGLYPPYRGTHVELDPTTHLLYTRGAVKYYHTYPGSYIPQPLEIRIVEADESSNTICNEIMSLTKLNWNNTQFDRKYPITLECARKVGQIMKYLEPHEEPQISYSFYM